MRSVLRVGTAGWVIPDPSRPDFPADGTQLERYAACFSCAEINSSFHRPHRPATFALKLPKEITHKRRLVDCEHNLMQFLEDTSALGVKRRVLLVQLPPSFAFDDQRVGRFLDVLRQEYNGDVVCEPRHASWFYPQAGSGLRN